MKLKLKIICVFIVVFVFSFSIKVYAGVGSPAEAYIGKWFLPQLKSIFGNQSYLPGMTNPQKILVEEILTGTVGLISTGLVNSDISPVRLMKNTSISRKWSTYALENFGVELDAMWFNKMTMQDVHAEIVVKFQKLMNSVPEGYLSGTYASFLFYVSKILDSFDDLGLIGGFTENLEGLYYLTSILLDITDPSLIKFQLEEVNLYDLNELVKRILGGVYSTQYDEAIGGVFLNFLGNIELQYARCIRNNLSQPEILKHMETDLLNATEDNIKAIFQRFDYKTENTLSYKSYSATDIMVEEGKSVKRVSPFKLYVYSGIDVLAKIINVPSYLIKPVIGVIKRRPPVTNRMVISYLSFMHLLNYDFNNKMVLDVGAGASRFTQIINYAYGETGTEAIGLDLFAKSKGPFYVVDNATALPFKEDVFDLVVSNWLIPHFKKVDGIKFINGMIKVTKPGGKVIFRPVRGDKPWIDKCLEENPKVKKVIKRGSVFVTYEVHL